MKKPKPVKVSELIKQLQSWKRKHGDIPVLLDSNSVDWRVDEEHCLEAASARVEKVYRSENSSRLRPVVVIGCPDEERKYAYMTAEERSEYFGEESSDVGVKDE
jgi:hypothetical protein